MHIIHASYRPTVYTVGIHLDVLTTDNWSGRVSVFCRFSIGFLSVILGADFFAFLHDERCAFHQSYRRYVLDLPG